MFNELLNYGNIKLEDIHYKKQATIPLLIVSDKLDENKQNKLLKLFFKSYYNTNQEVEDFSCEFFAVTEFMFNNKIPLDLKYLNVKEIYKDIIEILKEGA